MLRKPIALALVAGVVAGAIVGSLAIDGRVASAQVTEPWGGSPPFPGDPLAEPGDLGRELEGPSPDRHTLIYPWFLDEQVDVGLEEGYGWARKPFIGAYASGMFIGPGTSRRVLFTDSNSPLDLRTTDATLGYEVAPKLTIAAAFQPGGLGVAEATYFGVDNWSARANVTDGDFIQNDILGFSATDVTDLSYSLTSELQSFETNLRFFDAPIGWGLLVGARYIEQRDRLRISDRFLNRGGVAGSDTFRFNTDNQMLGLQLGLDAGFAQGPWRLDGRMKAGIFGNDSRRFGEAIVPGIDTGFASFDVRDTRVSYLGEFNVTCSYYVLPGVALTVGYQLMVFDGLAVATEQLDGPNATGDPVYNGGLVGLEIYR